MGQKNELINRFFEPPKQSFFLFGPRGTGKSTWMKELFPKSLYLNLLLSSIREKLRAIFKAITTQLAVINVIPIIFPFCYAHPL